MKNPYNIDNQLSVYFLREFLNISLMQNTTNLSHIVSSFKSVKRHVHRFRYTHAYTQTTYDSIYHASTYR